MKAVRNWSIRNARWIHPIYAAFEWFLALISPLLKRIGYERLDKPFAAVEGDVITYDKRMMIPHGTYVDLRVSRVGLVVIYI